MTEAGGDLDLPQEAFGPDSFGDLGAQDLERDLAMVPEILGQEDRSGPTATELALDRVPIS